MFSKFQNNVGKWLIKCFGKEISYDVDERNARFLEEALELVQSTGMTKDAAVKLVEYVFDRPKGEVRQEVGGVVITLDALCFAHQIDREICGTIELDRIWGKIDSIREKQKAKPSLGIESNVYPERK